MFELFCVLFKFLIKLCFYKNYLKGRNFITLQEKG